MQYFVQQKVLTIFRNLYQIKDETGNVVYHVKSSLTIPYKLTFFNEKEEVVLQVKKRYFRLLSRYDVKVNNKLVAILKKRVGFFSKRFKTKSKNAKLNNIKIHGDVLGFSFKLTKDDALIVSIGKKFLTIGDRYAIDVTDEENANIYLAIVIAIDDIVHKAKFRNVFKMFH